MYRSRRPAPSRRVRPVAPGGQVTVPGAHAQLEHIVPVQVEPEGQRVSIALCPSLAHTRRVRVSTQVVLHTCPGHIGVVVHATGVRQRLARQIRPAPPQSSALLHSTHRPANRSHTSPRALHSRSDPQRADEASGASDGVRTSDGLGTSETSAGVASKTSAVVASRTSDDIASRTSPLSGRAWIRWRAPSGSRPSGPPQGPQTKSIS